MKKTKTKAQEKVTASAEAGSREAGAPGESADKGVRDNASDSSNGAPSDQSATTTLDSVEELQARVEKLTDSLHRAKADLVNFQRRSSVERSESIRYANAELMKSLLSVLDDFERSLAAAEETDNLEAVVDGVRLVHQNFVKTLRLQGLSPIEALHLPFDPSIHEALLQQPSRDHPPGTVIEEVAGGYRLYDRVVRPAKVVVSKAIEADNAASCDGGTQEPESKDRANEDGTQSAAS